MTLRVDGLALPLAPGTYLLLYNETVHTHEEMIALAAQAVMFDINLILIATTHLDSVQVVHVSKPRKK